MSILFRPGDCLSVFGAEPDASFDAFVSDWPAGVAFLGRGWDKAHGGRDAWVKVWAERAAMMLRKAKPGAYSLTWALPRTAHWAMTALEDGGWTLQDVIVHAQSQGWPKSRAALKPASEHWILARNGSGGELQIDAARVARGDALPVMERTRGNTAGAFDPLGGDTGKRTGETSTAGSWPTNFALSHDERCEERGTRTVKGSGAQATGPTRSGSSLSLARGRIGGSPSEAIYYGETETIPAFDCLAGCDCGLSVLASSGGDAPRCACGASMTWACPVAAMDADSGVLTSGVLAAGTVRSEKSQASYSGSMPRVSALQDFGGTSGGASRFFPSFKYQAKAHGGERDAGCEDLYWRLDKKNPFGFSRVTREEWETLTENNRGRGNVHPTLKSLALMGWLVSLLCPPGGRVGDLTSGSGSTGLAIERLNVARNLGASFLGSDICPEAVEIAEARLRWWKNVRLDVKPTRASVREDATEIQTSLFDRGRS